MARRPASTLRVIETQPRVEELEPLDIEVPSDEIAPGVTFKDGVLHTENEDGSTTIDFNPSTLSAPEEDDDFYANLVSKFDDSRLQTIASQLIDGINRDIESRKEWMETEARGIQLLGLKLEEPRGDMGTASAPLEGMSTVRHPLLLEATVNFQATAIGEFLPAGGPVKVRNDTPMKSPSQEQEAQSGPVPGLPPGLPMLGGMAGGGLPGPPGPPPAGFADGGAVSADGDSEWARFRRDPTSGQWYGITKSGREDPVSGATVKQYQSADPGPEWRMSPRQLKERGYADGGSVMQSGPSSPGAQATQAPQGKDTSLAAQNQPGTMPVNPAQQANPMATEVAQPPMEEKDSLADALEKDFNHYLTVTATEYVPDTDRMFFGVGFRGDGFKKVYNCPLRRRPVSELIDTKDFIVSNNANDLENCPRYTHRIRMPRSTLKRMQILKVYADVPLDLPTPHKEDVVEQAINETEGRNPAVLKPEDLPYEIYECYCELDEDKFAPEGLKGKGLPLPYRVTIEVNSKKILSIVRNWKQDDDLARPKQFFVQFPFIRGLGFYGYGFVHLLGNTTSTLTAMWREMVDSGMFSNFPGFLYLKSIGRQLSNQIRVPPGGGFGVDAPVSGKIGDAIMPLPYKDIGSAFTAFAQWVEGAGQRLGQTAQIAVGEGKQEAPVGTTLALIEQATKMLNAVHKRLHGAQDKEFQLLKERFREDPEAFWRFNRTPTMAWEKQQFLKALDDYNLVPVADPNNPTSLHRTAKAAIIEGLATKYPLDIDRRAALRRVFRTAGIDSDGLLLKQSLPPPPDPRMEAIKAKGEQIDKTNAAQQQTTTAKSMATVIMTLKQLESAAEDRASKERIEQMRMAFEERARQHEAFNDRAQQISDIQLDQFRADAEARNEHRKNQQQMWADLIRQAMEMQADHTERQNQHQADMMDRAHEARIAHHSARQDHAHEQQRHEAQMERDRQAHEQKLAHERALNDEKIRAARAMARATPKAKKGK